MEKYVWPVVPVVGGVLHKASLYEVGLVMTVVGLCWLALCPSSYRIVLVVLASMVLLMEQSLEPLLLVRGALERMFFCMGQSLVPLGAL